MVKENKGIEGEVRVNMLRDLLLEVCRLGETEAALCVGAAFHEAMCEHDAEGVRSHEYVRELDGFLRNIGADSELSDHVREHFNELTEEVARLSSPIQ